MNRTIFMEIRSSCKGFIQLVGIAHTLVLDIFIVYVLALGVDVMLQIILFAFHLSQLSFIRVID